MTIHRPNSSRTSQETPKRSGAQPAAFAAALFTAVDQSTEGVALVESGGEPGGTVRVVYANAAFAIILDRSGGDVLGASLEALFEQASPADEIRAVLLRGRSAELELRLPGGGDRTRTLELALEPVHGLPDGIPWLCRLRDVSAKHRAALEQSERERLSAVALVAASLAHEINNPLASITTNLEWLAAALPQLTPATRSTQPLSAISAALVDALAGAERVETTIEHLILLSGVEYTQRELADVRLLLDSSLRELEPLFGGGVAIARDYEDVPPVFVNERRLKQAFGSLLTNAMQSVSVDGRDRRVVVRTRAAARVRIEIEDFGTGVPDAVLSSLFRPFVTTKPRGLAKGLGLYLAKTIVEGAGGSIGCDPKRSASGALFWLELPRANQSP